MNKLLVANHEFSKIACFCFKTQCKIVKKPFSCKILTFAKIVNFKLRYEAALSLILRRQEMKQWAGLKIVS